MAYQQSSLIRRIDVRIRQDGVSMAVQFGEERRLHPRIYIPFPATVHGISQSGKPFRNSTVLDDLSAGGLNLRISERLDKDATISIETQFSIGTDPMSKGARVSLVGRVVRVESLMDGVYATAVQLDKYRFL